MTINILKGEITKKRGIKGKQKTQDGTTLT